MYFSQIYCHSFYHMQNFGSVSCKPPQTTQIMQTLLPRLQQSRCYCCRLSQYSSIVVDAQERAPNSPTQALFQQIRNNCYLLGAATDFQTATVALKQDRLGSLLFACRSLILVHAITGLSSADQSSVHRFKCSQSIGHWFSVTFLTQSVPEIRFEGPKNVPTGST